MSKYPNYRLGEHGSKDSIMRVIPRTACYTVARLYTYNNIPCKEFTVNCELGKMSLTA